MHSKHPPPAGLPSNRGSTKGTDHKIKGAICADKLKHTPCLSLDKFMDECVEATLSSFEKTNHLDKDDPEREKIGACLKAKNKEAIDKQLTDKNKKNSEDKQQGKQKCHTGGGSCENREHHGKSSNAITKSGVKRFEAAKKEGRC